ncbi:mitochondrial E3 ubiquitin protein ligase 1-like isoform X1 [Aphis craccivora]|uniref:Mitochondrial E3 ubiquitin protein ligase 1-like isoform X1 n=1 Tax=Aphis craccivora TaxID=307492 RepID=A0A6G0YJF5_APHCR|nr:mitochondrial E3 ubiquitin protein ligase 1-like isoform X1 [Aphis craccivora]
MSKNCTVASYNYLTTIICTGIFSEMLSVSRQNRQTNNVLEISHRNLMSHIQNPNPSPWLFLENLITQAHGIMNDYRLAVDGLEVRQPRPRASNLQDKKITLGLTKLDQNRFTVAEFLGYTKHVIPNFGIERPQNEGKNSNGCITLRLSYNRMVGFDVEPVININQNIELPEQVVRYDNEPEENILENIEPRNRVVIGYELPPEFFQEVLRHYNSESLEPLLIYAEQESMADDDFGQVHNINFDDLHQVQDHYDEEPLVWPIFQFEPQRQIINEINNFPHIEIRRSNDEVENMREIVVCVACMSTVSNIVLRPYNHVCLCGECFEGLDRLVCPLCKSVITEKIVILDE